MVGPTVGTDVEEVGVGILGALVGGSHAAAGTDVGLSARTAAGD